MSFSILEKIKNVTNVEEIYREFNATDIEFAEDTLISLFENSVKSFRIILQLKMVRIVLHIRY